MEFVIAMMKHEPPPNKVGISYMLAGDKETEAKDPDPSKPYMMWAGTPYEHAMVPVGPAN
jgi:hypothetical protein